MTIYDEIIDNKVDMIGINRRFNLRKITLLNGYTLKLFQVC
jgi:hypothetical protein